ncbi:ornithine carbamoyltransferase [Nocardioides sp.]|uniref:ornithine carbamoyltransferase n=1 Tax=Nocardioides sp. TaxID=35761 RepID=UPI0035157029
MTRSLLRDDDLSPAEQAEILALAARLKADPYGHRPLTGPRTVAMVFDKPTLRTQASFAAGIAELGGHAMLVDGALAGIGKRESVADVARVLGRQASQIVWRTYAQTDLEQMAEYSGVPVINALTDDFHPCQLLADLLTLQEHFDRLAGLSVAFVGDAACNMGNSWALAGATAGVRVRFGCPDGYAPATDVVERANAIGATTGGEVSVTDDAAAAVAGVDVVITDTWVSMGKEDEAEERRRVFTPFAVTADLVAQAADHAVVLHCLPAYRGAEIAADVLDGPRSLVWEEAENRRHAQKAVMAWLQERAGS